MKSYTLCLSILCLLFFNTNILGKVGILISKNSAMLNAPVKGIKTVFGDATITLNMEGSAEKGAAHCKKFSSQGCSVVLAIGTAAAKVAKKELAGIPIVFCMIMNVKESGVAGKNITGVSLNIPIDKQFEAFKSVVPTLKKIGLVYSNQISTARVTEMKKASKSKGLVLIEQKVAGESEIPNAIRGMRGKIDGLYLPPDRTVAKHDAFQFIALFTFENNVPFMAPTSRFVKKGALVALMIDYEEIGKQAAALAKRIISGKSVSTIAIQPPEVTILVLNQKTAETIGINIPPSLTQSSKIIK